MEPKRQLKISTDFWDELPNCEKQLKDCISYYYSKKEKKCHLKLELKKLEKMLEENL